MIVLQIWLPAIRKKRLQKYKGKLTCQHISVISIYFGIYELLLTNEYIATNDCIIPFLGSAITIQLNEQCTKEIYIDTCGPIVINTERLLRKYMKLHSYKPWGFYSFDAFTKGFAPVTHFLPWPRLSKEQKNHRPPFCL